MNTTFGNSLEVLSFNLRLLIFSACSSFEDYQLLSERVKEPDTSLALLDSSLCLAWLRVFFVICYKVQCVSLINSVTVFISSFVS